MEQELQQQQQRTSPWYYVIQIMLAIYGLGYVATLVLIQNAIVPHTYFKANNNGVLYSLRYVSLYWYSLVFCAMRLFTFLVICQMLLYRKITCCGSKGTCCSVFWMMLLAGLTVVEIVNLTILGGYYGTCNGIGQVDNPCNDLLWCCASDIYMHSSNLCSNTAACNPVVTLAQLKPNIDFVWLFSTTVAFTGFDIFFLLLPIGLWMTKTTTQEEEDDEQRLPPPSQPKRLIPKKSTKQN
jgi:hypothetical protein